MANILQCVIKIGGKREDVKKVYNQFLPYINSSHDKSEYTFWELVHQSHIFRNCDMGEGRIENIELWEDVREEKAILSFFCSFHNKIHLEFFQCLASLYQMDYGYYVYDIENCNCYAWNSNVTNPLIGYVYQLDFSVAMDDVNVVRVCEAYEEPLSVLSIINSSFNTNFYSIEEVEAFFDALNNDDDYSESEAARRAYVAGQILLNKRLSRNITGHIINVHMRVM